MFAVIVVIYNRLLGSYSIHLLLFVLRSSFVFALTPSVVRHTRCMSSSRRGICYAKVDWIQAEDDTASNSVSCSYLPRREEGEWLAARPYSSTDEVADVDFDAHADSTATSPIHDRREDVEESLFVVLPTCMHPPHAHPTAVTSNKAVADEGRETRGIEGDKGDEGTQDGRMDPESFLDESSPAASCTPPDTTYAPDK